MAYGVRALDENDLLGALPWFAEALRQDRDTPRTGLAHRLRLGTLLQQCPTIVQMWFTDCPFNFAQFAGQENQVLVPTADRRWAVHDLATGRMLYPPFGKPGSSDTVSISPASGLATTSSLRESSKTVTVWSLVTGQEVASLSGRDATHCTRYQSRWPLGRRLGARQRRHCLESGNARTLSGAARAHRIHRKHCLQPGRASSGHRQP